MSITIRRTHVIFDDARHYLLTTTEKYDVIASDPLDVFVKGTAAIYSKEYFESVKAHLNPGGMFTLYVPLYESDERTVRASSRRSSTCFPYGTVWANTIDGAGYDMVFMGQVEPLEDRCRRGRATPGPAGLSPVVESLRGIGINSEIDLFGTYAGPTQRSWHVDSRARKSIATRTCACNIWAAGESTRGWRIICTARS